MTHEKLQRQWEHSLDPCKSLILLLLKPYKGEVREVKKVANSTLKNIENSRILSGDASVWNDENIGFQTNQGLLKSEWTKQTEEVYNGYKKELAKSHKDKTHHRYSKHILTTDLASTFRITRDHLKLKTKISPSTIISLKDMQKVIY
jgi:hypothetical protein